MKTATKLLVLLLTLAALMACIFLLSLPASAETVASGKWCDESTYCAGSPLWLNMELTNRGTAAVDSVTVEIFDEQDKLLNRQTLSVGLLPGETVEKDAYFIPAKALAGMNVTVKVMPTDQTDDKPETNSASLSISYENVSVENLTAGVREDGLTAVTANIVNYGYAARENITVALRSGTANGEIIATQTVGRIGSMDMAVVSFPVEATDGMIFYVTLEDWDDSLSGDDSDFVRLSVSSEPDLNGDVNGDGIVNIQDVTVLLTLLATDAPTIVAADVNRNGIVNIQDVTELLTILATG